MFWGVELTQEHYYSSFRQLLMVVSHCLQQHTCHQYCHGISHADVAHGFATTTTAPDEFSAAPQQTKFGHDANAKSMNQQSCAVSSK
eukprot:1746605-Amphidinium_carterae.1